MMTTAGQNDPGWDRRRLLAGLAGVVLVALVLIAGLAYTVHATLTGTRSQDRQLLPAGVHSSSPAGRPSDRDLIAAQPMLQVAPEDARPTTPAALPAPVIVVPASTRTGPAGVPAGFPRTPEGAVAQLASMTTSVLQVMSIPRTTAIYDGWALPDGVGAAGWELTANAQAFLGAVGMGNTLDPAARVVAFPAAGQVKGVDGPGWVLACVLLEVRATVTAEARMGYGHCARMQWHQGRWMIAPGAPAARAPSTWPGTEAAKRAGWRTWADEGQG
jgi:hypothetical protein